MKYKETGIEWFGIVPQHWKVNKLSLNVPFKTGFTPSTSKSEFYGGEHNWVTIDDLNGGIVTNTKTRLSNLGIDGRKGKLIKKGSLFYSFKLTVGKVGFAGEDMYTNEAIASFEPNDRIDINFLYYSFSDYLLNNAKENIYGAQLLNSELIKNSKILVPPKKEQVAIADYLDKACERIDKIIEIKEEQIRQIKLVKKSRIEEAVKFGLEKDASDREDTRLEYLPEINNGWKIDRFKDVASLRNDKTDIKSEEENYLELEDLSQGTGEIINLRNTLEVASKTTKFFKGDVLFGKLRPYLEKYAHVDFDGLCTGEILAFEPKRIEGKFLMYIISSNWFINLCNSMSYGAKMPRVNWNTQLSKIYLPIPSKEEQLEIIKSLDELSFKSNQLTKKIKNQIKTLKNYRKSLIHECVTGKKQVVKVETTQSI